MNEGKIEEILKKYKGTNKGVIEELLNYSENGMCISIHLDTKADMKGRISNLFHSKNPESLPYGIKIKEGQTEKVVQYKDIVS